MVGDGYVERLAQLIDMLREKGVVHYKDEDLELHLGPAPLSEKEKKELAKVIGDPKRQKRLHYEVQFNRPVNDKELDALPELG